MGLVELLLAAMVLGNIYLFLSSRILVYVKITAFQGVLLGVLSLLGHLQDIELRLAVIVAATTIVKGGLLPWFLARTVRDTGIKREVEPVVGFVFSCLLGVGLLGISMWVVGNLPLVEGSAMQRTVGVGLFTAFSGLFLCVARASIVSQAVGYLVLENGVFLAGMAFQGEAPLLVELGVLLDVAVAVFLMAVMIHSVKREFSSLDADRLRELRD